MGDDATVGYPDAREVPSEFPVRSVTYCFWRVPNDFKPGTHITRWRMTREAALAQWPTAIEAGGHEVRQVAETAAEKADLQRSMHFDPGKPSWMTAQPRGTGPAS